MYIPRKRELFGFYLAKFLNYIWDLDSSFHYKTLCGKCEKVTLHHVEAYVEHYFKSYLEYETCLECKHMEWK